MGYQSRDRDRGSSRYRSRSRSDSYERRKTYRRDRSRSDSRDRHRRDSRYDSRDHRDHHRYDSRDRNHHSKHSYESKYDRGHSRRRSESRDSDDIKYEGREEEEIDQKIRIALRTNSLQYDQKLNEKFKRLPEQKAQQLQEQAFAPERINECVLVRQLFISGMNDMNEDAIRELMGKYGEIQNIEVIKNNFAFVKYFRVEDASNACADYHNILASLQSLVSSSFKIFFADHLKRWNVVSNHQDYEILEYLVPVVYASVKNDPQFTNEKYLMKVFERYGFVRNLKVRENEFPGPKIHVNVEYQTLGQAMRARSGLNRHREKLGEKRAEIAILIDTEKIVKVFPHISNQIRYQKKRLYSINPAANPNSHSNLGVYNPHSGQPSLPPLEPYAQAMGRSSMQPTNMNPSSTSGSSIQTEDIFAMLEKLNENPKDKASEMIAEENEAESDWVGFFTRNMQFKVEVDFNRIHKDVNFELESILNVSHRGSLEQALNRTDYVMAGKFKAANSLNSEQFQEYINYFKKKNKGGVIFAKDYLIYLLPPMEDLKLPYQVATNELLALFFEIEN